MIMMDRLGEAAEIAPALAPHIPGLLRCFDHLGAEMLDTQRVHGSISGRHCIRPPAGRSSTSRASQRKPWQNDALSTPSGETSPACCARSTMRRRACQGRAALPGPQSAGPPSSGVHGGQLSAAGSTMLRAYEADKAIYEVVYETRNRPDWVGIPLRAVAALASDNRDSVPPGEREPGESREPAQTG